MADTKLFQARLELKHRQALAKIAERYVPDDELPANAPRSSSRIAAMLRMIADGKLIVTEAGPEALYDTVYTVLDKDNDSKVLYKGPDVADAREAARGAGTASIRVWRKLYGHSVDYEFWRDGKRWNSSTGNWEEVQEG